MKKCYFYVVSFSLFYLRWPYPVHVSPMKCNKPDDGTNCPWMLTIPYDIVVYLSHQLCSHVVFSISIHIRQFFYFPPHDIMNPSHCDTSAVNIVKAHGTVATSCSGPHPHPPHLDPPLSSSLAFKDADTETACVWKAHCRTSS